MNLHRLTCHKINLAIRRLTVVQGMFIQNVPDLPICPHNRNFFHILSSEFLQSSSSFYYLMWGKQVQTMIKKLTVVKYGHSFFYPISFYYLFVRGVQRGKFQKGKIRFKISIEGSNRTYNYFISSFMMGAYNFFQRNSDRPPATI